MKKSSWIILIIVLVLFGVLIYQGTSNHSNLSDEEQISALLSDGRSAVEQKSLRRALTYISDDYTDSSGLSADAVRAMLIRAFRDNAKYSVVLADTNIQIKDENALVSFTATVYANYNPTDAMEVFSGPIQLQLRKEKSRKWFIIPVSNWRITGASGLPTGIGD